MKWDEYMGQFQYEHGMFPASPNSVNPCMRRVWARDNYINWWASDGELKKSIEQGFEGYFDAQRDRIERNAQTPPQNEEDHNYPLLDEDLKWFGGKWGMPQHDATGDMLDVFSTIDDRERSSMLADNLYNRNTTGLLTSG